MESGGKMFDANALLPLMAKLICCVAVPFVESVTMKSGAYVPCPPICEPVIAPVLASSDKPSGGGG